MQKKYCLAKAGPSRSCRHKATHRRNSSIQGTCHRLQAHKPGSTQPDQNIDTERHSQFLKVLLGAVAQDGQDNDGRHEGQASSAADSDPAGLLVRPVVVGAEGFLGALRAEGVGVSKRCQLATVAPCAQKHSSKQAPSVDFCSARLGQQQTNGGRSTASVPAYCRGK